MRKIFFISFLLISFCSFSQSYKGGGDDIASGYDFMVDVKITKISDGKYSGKLMKSAGGKVVKFDIFRFEKDLEVSKYGEFIIENCNITFYEEKKRTTKCSIHKSKNGVIFLYFWDDFNEKYDNRLGEHHWTLLPVE